MKVIVIQRHIENLFGIQAAVAEIDECRAMEITFTQEDCVVEDAVRDGAPAIVISGQVLGFGVLGTDLARRVKEANPNAQFYIYSVMPELNEAVDGVIPKQNRTALTGRHPVLAKILAGNLESMTPEIMKQILRVS